MIAVLWGNPAIICRICGYEVVELGQHGCCVDCLVKCQRWHAMNMPWPASGDSLTDDMSDHDPLVIQYSKDMDAYWAEKDRLRRLEFTEEEFDRWLTYILANSKHKKWIKQVGC